MKRKQHLFVGEIRGQEIPHMPNITRKVRGKYTIQIHPDICVLNDPQTDKDSAWTDL